MSENDKDKDERKLKKVKIALMRNKIFALYQGEYLVTHKRYSRCIRA